MKNTSKPSCKKAANDSCTVVSFKSIIIEIWNRNGGSAISLRDDRSCRAGRSHFLSLLSEVNLGAEQKSASFIGLTFISTNWIVLVREERRFLSKHRKERFEGACSCVLTQSIQGSPSQKVETYIWALPVWGVGRGGLNACPDGLGHLSREELCKFKWAYPCFLGGINAFPDGLGH